MFGVSREEFDKLSKKVDKLSKSGLTNESKKKREPSDYNRFMSEQYKIIQKENPAIDSKSIFKMVTAKWALQKDSEEKDSEKEKK